MSIDTPSPRQQTSKTRPRLRQTITTDHPPSFTAIISAPLPIGKIGFICTNQGISQLHFLPGRTHLQGPSASPPQTELAQRLITALQHYFSHPQASFSLPQAAMGTPFQHRVWQAISAIPSGETRSYGQLAQMLNSSARAVGGACRANPLPLLVPCHRVISASGQLGGFLGQAAPQGMARDIKQWLLEHESTGLQAHEQQH